MTSKMQNNDFETKVMEMLQEIKNLLGSAASDPSMKEKKTRKPRDPNAAPNPWIVFTGKVRAALKAAGKPAGKECQQFASYLKAEFKEGAYEMEDSEILAAHADWTPPPPKPKESKDEIAEKSESESKPKPKRTLTEEQKEKMAAGRRAAAERRKAEAAAKSADTDEAEAEAEAPAPARAPAPAKPAPTLKAFPFKGKRYLRDEEGGGLWAMGEGGAQGAWVGKLAADKKSIDTSATDYTA
jgi:hypothetical protein